MVRVAGCGADPFKVVYQNIDLRSPLRLDLRSLVQIRYQVTDSGTVVKVTFRLARNLFCSTKTLVPIIQAPAVRLEVPYEGVNPSSSIPDPPNLYKARQI